MTFIATIKSFLVTRYHLLVPVLLVLIALPLAGSLIDAGKQGKPKKAKHKITQTRIVNVRRLQQQDYQPSWYATATVQPAESVKLVAEVVGKVTALNPTAQPGALMNAGEWLLQVDKADYLLAMRNQQAQVVQAQSSLELERGNQILAQQELILVEDSLSTARNTRKEQVLQQTLQQTLQQEPQQALQEQQDLSLPVMLEHRALVLREPQIAAAKAKLDNARASLEKAQLNLSRTQVVMPFRGQVIKRHIGRGSKVTQNSALFDVVNVDHFWLEVKIPRSFLTLLDHDAAVAVSHPQAWGKGVERSARIVSVLPDVDSRDRQVKVLLVIDDPLSLQDNASSQKRLPAVFINDFLSVRLAGKLLHDTWAIDPNWLQSDNSIWIVDKENRLQKRPVTVLFKGRDTLYVQAAFNKGELALAEKLSIATPGMQVKARRKKALLAGQQL